METGCRMGVLAGFYVPPRRGVGSDDGYAVRTAEKAIDAIKIVFSSVYGASSAEFDSSSSKVKGMMSDQALQKTCLLLKERHFTNCVLLHRDPAQAVRISVKDPLPRADALDVVACDIDAMLSC